MFRFGLILAGVVFVLDQIAKYIVLGPLAFSPPGCRELAMNCGQIPMLPFFSLSMVWNQGVSFGMLRAEADLGRWALGLVIGGALGNVIDRVRFGAVADFLDFRGLFFPWVFNVADAAITVGAALLLLDFLLHGEERKTAAPNNGHEAG